MKKITKPLIFLSLAGSMVACATISYTPAVSLDVSPRLIHKSALVEKFKDTSPLNDKITPFSGISVTNHESLANKLDIEVTNAVVADFSTNGVFKEVNRQVDNPDFIIKGEIKKFYGNSRPSSFIKVSVLVALASIIVAPAIKQPWLFWVAFAPELAMYAGAPTAKNTSEVEIVLSLYDADDNLINTYTGKAGGETSSSMYNDKGSSVPSMTNKTFSKAIMQIREQILKDADLLDK